MVSNVCSSLPLTSGRGIQQKGLQSGPLTPTSSIQALERHLCSRAPGSCGTRTLSFFPSSAPPAHTPTVPSMPAPALHPCADLG